MGKIIAKLILKLFGWRTQNQKPAEIKKFVAMMAPHTSNWDFVIGWLGYKSLGFSSKYLIKKEAFFFPMGGLLKSLGAIPVDRKASNSIVVQVGEQFLKRNEFILTVTPEGTRSLNKNWKRGYYYIAEHAKVPIVLCFLDYKKKLGGIGSVFYPTGNYEADLKEIEKFYENINAKYPEKFNLSIVNRDKNLNP